MNIFVKHAIQLALDRKDREREMVSVLLASLTPSVIAPDQMALGFTRILAGADDLALDIPDAARLLTLFLGRAIVDEALPPKFLAEVVPTLPANGLGLGVVQATGGMLSARHAAERFARAWHRQDATVSGDARVLSESIADLIKEYFASEDEAEAARCIRDLDCPHFHHELVYQICIASLDDPSKDKCALLLLQHLAETGEITQTQLAKGFRRLNESVEDLKLDYVKAPDQIASWESKAISDGWLSSKDNA